MSADLSRAQQPVGERSRANALHSLYGGKVARIGVEQTNARPQEVHTPEWILDAVCAAFGGERIALDPCAASDPAHWFAHENKTLSAEAHALTDELARTKALLRKESLKKEKSRLRKERARLKKALDACYLDLPDSLVDRTFVNPPFGFLLQWMRLIAVSSAPSLGFPNGRRIVSLVPVRTRRPWWPRYARGANGVWLAAFPFVGSKNAFPADVALLAFNCKIPPLGKRETGRFVL